MSVTLIDIIRKFNISSLLILPAINHAEDKLLLDGDKVGMMQILEESFIGAYSFISKELEESTNLKNGKYQLFIVLNSELAQKNIKGLYPEGANCLNIILSHPGIKGATNISDSKYCIIQLDLSSLSKDLDKIYASSYSSVSKDYLDLVRFKAQKAKFKNKYVKYIMINNLAGAIIVKRDDIREEIEDILGVRITESQELLHRFSADKETLTYEMLT